MAGASGREVLPGVWSQLWTGLSPGAPAGEALVVLAALREHIPEFHVDTVQTLWAA